MNTHIIEYLLVKEKGYGITYRECMESGLFKKYSPALFVLGKKYFVETDIFRGTTGERLMSMRIMKEDVFTMQELQSSIILKTNFFIFLKFIFLKFMIGRARKPPSFSLG